MDPFKIVFQFLFISNCLIIRCSGIKKIDNYEIPLYLPIIDVDTGVKFHHNDLIVLDLASSLDNVKIYDFGRILNIDFVLTQRTYLEKCVKKMAVKTCTYNFFSPNTEEVTITTMPYKLATEDCFSDKSRLGMQLKSCSGSFLTESIIQQYTSTTTIISTLNQLTNVYTLSDGSKIKFKSSKDDEIVIFEDRVSFKRVFENNECKVPTTVSTKFFKYSFGKKHYYSFENADKLYLDSDFCTIFCDKQEYLVIRDSGVYQIPDNFDLDAIDECDGNNELSFEIHNENNVENMIISDLYRVSTIMNELLVNKTVINYLDFQLFIPFSVGIHRIFYFDDGIVKTKHSLVDKCVVNTHRKTYHCATFDEHNDIDMETSFTFDGYNDIDMETLFTECLNGFQCGPNGIIFDKNFTRMIYGAEKNYEILSHLNVPVGEFSSSVNMTIINHQTNLVKHDLDIFLNFNNTESSTWLSKKGEEAWNSMVGIWDDISNMTARFKFYVEMFVGLVLVLIILRLIGFGCIRSCFKQCCKCSKRKRKERNVSHGEEDIEMGMM